MWDSVRQKGGDFHVSEYWRRKGVEKDKPWGCQASKSAHKWPDKKSIGRNGQDEIDSLYVGTVVNEAGSISLAEMPTITLYMSTFGKKAPTTTSLPQNDNMMDAPSTGIWQN